MTTTAKAKTPKPKPGPKPVKKSDRPARGYKLQGWDAVRFTKEDMSQYQLSKSPKLQRDGKFSKPVFSKPVNVKNLPSMKKSIKKSTKK